MPSTPAMTTGIIFLNVGSGRSTPVFESDPCQPVRALHQRLRTSAAARQKPRSGAYGGKLEDMAGMSIIRAAASPGARGHVDHRAVGFALSLYTEGDDSPATKVPSRGVSFERRLHRKEHESV